METQKPSLRDKDGEEVDVHMYRSMIGSLMYLTSSRHDIMFAVCACARYQVNPKVLHLYAVKRIFKYLKGQLKLGLWYPKDYSFDLVAYADSDYVGASLDRKSTAGVQVCVDDIIFGSTRKELCNAFERLMHEKFQMSSIGELTFFLGLQVKQKKDGLFISQDKYVAEILKKFRFTEVKNKSTPMKTQKPSLRDKDSEEVDVHMYRSMVGSLMYLTSSRHDIMFAVCACARYQVNPKVLHLYAVKRIFRVDGKEIIISESSVRRDLRLADEDGVDCLPNSTIFENIELMGDSTEYVTDEAVYKELDDRLVRAATIASSLEAEQDNDNIDKTQSKETPNKASSSGTTSGGGLKCQETMVDTLAQTRFKNVKITQALEITSLKMRVKKLKKKQRSRTYKLKRLYKVGLTAREDSSEDEHNLGEDASKQGRIKSIDADEDINLVNNQDNAEMFDVNDLHANTAGEVNDASITTTDSAAATITTEEVTLAKALAELKASKHKVKRVLYKSQVTYNNNNNNLFKITRQRTKLVEDSSKRAGEELTQERSKKQKVDDDKETAELKKLIEIILNEEEVAIDAISLDDKSPKIVD
nr:uncharacterized mitochondrial protein AtMg00810-like [Tanacetum cinerariifolium]